MDPLRRCSDGSACGCEDIPLLVTQLLVVLLMLLEEDIPLLVTWLLFMLYERPGERVDMEATDSSSSSCNPGRLE